MLLPKLLLLKKIVMKVFLAILTVIFIGGCIPNEMRAERDGDYPRLCKTFKATESDQIADTFVANRALWQTFNARYTTSTQVPESAKPRKLVVFMDGTGNDKTASTNVRKLYRLAVQHACKGNRIVPYYDKGVGSKWFDRVRGGIAGRGTSLNIRQAYRFLVEAYIPGDEIYLIGFSRGAFTARSLNGLIEFSGLVDRKTIQEKWHDNLPLPGITNLHFSIAALYDVYHKTFDGRPGFEERLRAELMDVMRDRNMEAYKGKVRVTAIGVFDTVPALGLFRDDEPDDHRLELYAQYGFHALALDEQRDDFRLLRFDPLRAVDGSHLEEVWFAGVHSDVGGSYSMEYNCTSKDNYAGIATTPLNWMIGKLSKFEIFPPSEQLIEIARQDASLFRGCDGAFNGKPFIECDCGLLHDEFFDARFGFFQNMGTFPRRPNIKDSIHRSVLRRINLQNLFRPHVQRELGGRYLFLGRPNPNNINEYFEKTFEIVD
jgi:hypothetical protein